MPSEADDGDGGDGVGETWGPVRSGRREVGPAKWYGEKYQREADFGGGQRSEEEDLVRGDCDTPWERGERRKRGI